MFKPHLFFLFHLLITASLFAIESDAFSEETQFYKTNNENVRGIVIAAHGLNVKPSKMGVPGADGTLAAFFLKNGFHVLRITLSGHSGDISEMKNVTAALWLDDAYSAYNFAKLLAPSLPVYLAGFSLGALVYEQLMNEQPEVTFKKAILFSPAIAVKDTAKSILLLDLFLKDDSIINSRSPEDYRAQKGCSLNAYKALFNLENSLSESSYIKNNIDTLIFLDKKDELIDIKKIKQNISKFNLSKWSVCEIDGAKGDIKPAYHHLLIDKNAVGAASWNIIEEKMLEFLLH